MKLLLVRHALPLRTDDGADPELAPLGHEQATRMATAVLMDTVGSIVSSPQQRARQTATPLAGALGRDIDVVDGLAEYDRDFPGYIPIEEAALAAPDDFARIRSGLLPSAVDTDAFISRVVDTAAAIASEADHDETVVAFAHGGVINVLLHDILGTATPLSFPIDYCSITRIVYSRSGKRIVGSINETQHVWDLLPRNRQRSSSTS